MAQGAAVSDTAPLFRPLTVRGLELPNRVVMAPMTRSMSPGGVPGDDVRAYYARRAAADVGLILSEGTTTRRPAASNDPDVPNFHTPEALAGWRGVIDAVHAAGGRMGPQLWHVGMLRKPGTGPHPDAPSDSPSGLTHKGKAVLPQPTEEEVQDMAAAYADAARSAAELGFDCVELHGAHGYLIDQFFWGVMNHRTDRFGGQDAVGRTAFAAEVVRLTREAVGDLPISFRWSQWKQQLFEEKLTKTPDELETFLAPLVEAGVDIIHASTRRFWEPEFPEVDGERGLNLAGWCKKLSGLPTITVGSVGLKTDFVRALRRGEGAEAASLDELLRRLDRDEFDLVAVGRALLQDPGWASKVKAGRLDELADFDPVALETLG